MSGAERRRQLLDVTKRLVGKRGFHGLSVDAIAREAGISRPIVYAHFGDLAGLLEAMLERESAGALGQLAEVLPGGLEDEGPPASLLSALRGYLEAVRSDPVRWRLVLMPPEGAPELLREQIRSGRDAVIAALSAYVERGVTPAEGSPDPELTARLLSAVADEAARLLLTDPHRYSIERLTGHAAWLLGRLDTAQK
jgi:AcrR family transcriptional regulator